MKLLVDDIQSEVDVEIEDFVSIFRDNKVTGMNLQCI